jgi:hypothetical protein
VGGAIVFVNALVRVVVKNASGATVREFVAGDSAPCVEIRSNSITGTAYSGGAVAPGNPTNLKLWADMWLASAGAPDFKALLNGVATNISSIVAAVAGLRYYVVTDPAYGAVGDGVTNDLGAIQAAINAANVAGGGVVFFPKGTYLVNGTLTSYNTVSLQGIARGYASIRVQSSSASLSTGAGFLSIAKLGILFSSAPFTGTLFNSTGGATTVDDVGVASTPSGTVFAGAAFTALEIFNSDVFVRGAGVLANLGASSTLLIRSSQIGVFGTVALSGTLCTAAGIDASDCFVYANEAGAGGTKTLFSSTGLTKLYNITGQGPDAGTVTVVSVGAAGRVFDSSVHFFTSTGTLLMYAASVAASTALSACKLGTRTLQTAVVSGDVDPVVVTALQSRHVQVRVTTTAGWTGNCQVTIDKAPLGADLIVSFWNDTAGVVTFEWGTNVSIAAATTFTVAANSMRMFHLVSSDNAPTSTTLEWFLVASTAGAEVVE